MHAIRLIFIAVVIGFSALVVQIILIRELLVVFTGNELAIGIFLANWLIAQAAGSYLAARRGQKQSHSIRAFALSQLPAIIYYPLTVILVRLLRSVLGLHPSEGMSLTSIYWLSFLILFIPGVLGGMQFSFACAVFQQLNPSRFLKAGTVYGFEALGGIFGGLAVTYVLIPLTDPLVSLCAVAVLNGIGLILVIPLQRPFAASFRLPAVLIILIYLAGFATGTIHRIHKSTIQLQWQPYQVDAYENSIYGNLVLLEREKQYEIYASGAPVSSFPAIDPSLSEEIVHIPALLHGAPGDVLIMGNSSGNIAAEVQKYPGVRIDVTELDPSLTGLIQPFVGETMQHPGTNIYHTDGRHFIRRTDQNYDLILINMPEPSTLEINRFYTAEFFSNCIRHLRPDGLVAFTLPGGASYINREILNLNHSIINAAARVFRYYHLIPDQTNICILSQETYTPETIQDTVLARLNRSAPDTRIISEPYLRYKLDPRRSMWFRDQSHGREAVPPNQDLHPVAVFFSLSAWNVLHAPLLASLYSGLFTAPFFYIATGFLIFMMLIGFIARKKHPAAWHLIVPVMTSGLAGMGITTLLALFFQAVFGYLYYWIGLIITGFMAGLALGTWLAGRLIHARAVLFSEILFVIYLGFLIAGFMIWRSLPAGLSATPAIQVIILLFAAGCGKMVGFQFAAANDLFHDIPVQNIRMSGTFYAADLTGAWMAGLIIPLVLIPVYGFVLSGLFLLICKAASLLILSIHQAR